jgi:predicted DCC family thiol-disulfide oxidoreductase YuxK
LHHRTIDNGMTSRDDVAVNALAGTTTQRSRPPDAPAGNAIILFDGVCNLCSGAVKFVLKRDRKGWFRFAALQTDTGRQLLESHGLPLDSMATIVLIEGSACFTKSTAALRIARHLGGLWPLATVFRIVPRPIRDAVYDFVARHRYRWFGKKPSCMIPSPEEAARFLE